MFSKNLLVNKKYIQVIKPSEKAMSLCQEIGRSTLFAEDCNGGYTLPLRVAKVIAKIVVKEVIEELDDRKMHISDFDENIINTSLSFWNDVDAEIDKMEV